MDGDDGHVPVGGAPPGPGLAAPPVLLPAVEPLQVFGDIEAAVNAIAVDDPAPMINMLEDMSARLNTLTLEQELSKRENAMRLTAARKAKVAATLSKLTNPMSQRAVTNNFLHIIGNIMTIFKPTGQILVPVNLDKAAATILAQIVLV